MRFRFLTIRDLALSAKTGDSNQRRRPNLADPTEKTLAAMKHFSLKHSADFLPISKSRRQPSLDSLLTSREGQRQQPAPDRNCCPLPLHVAGFPGDSTEGATSRRLAATSSSGSLRSLSRPTKSGESVPLNPNAGPTRILRRNSPSMKNVLLPFYWLWFSGSSVN
jgi:hypothetical protein